MTIANGDLLLMSRKTAVSIDRGSHSKGPLDQFVHGWDIQAYSHQAEYASATAQYPLEFSDRAPYEREYPLFQNHEVASLRIFESCPTHIDYDATQVFRRLGAPPTDTGGVTASHDDIQRIREMDIDPATNDYGTAQPSLRVATRALVEAGSTVDTEYAETSTTVAAVEIQGSESSKLLKVERTIWKVPTITSLKRVRVKATSSIPDVMPFRPIRLMLPTPVGGDVSQQMLNLCASPDVMADDFDDFAFRIGQGLGFSGASNVMHLPPVALRVLNPTITATQISDQYTVDGLLKAS
jgi:hypothetical protein